MTADSVVGDRQSWHDRQVAELALARKLSTHVWVEIGYRWPDSPTPFPGLVEVVCLRCHGNVADVDGQTCPADQ